MRLLFLKYTSNNKKIAPDNNLMAVKLAASMAFSPSANRHNTELPANAKSAMMMSVTF